MLPARRAISSLEPTTYLVGRAFELDAAALAAHGAFDTHTASGHIAWAEWSIRETLAGALAFTTSKQAEGEFDLRVAHIANYFSRCKRFYNAFATAGELQSAEDNDPVGFVRQRPATNYIKVFLTDGIPGGRLRPTLMTSGI
ncbi:MAG: hypothetical protein NTV86_10175 [Planctomycetota bacterium]|nr:hypothetical protein [Planctomycetota bacterium]